MQTIMWNKKRLIITSLVISFVLYVLLMNKNYTYKTDVVIKNVKPQIVWEFVADFSNVKKHLVTHIEDFIIISESGNYDHWQYSVKYTEPLPFWPYFKSIGIGHYSVSTNNNKYIIQANHTICFFNGWSCSKSNCNFHISEHEKYSTLYEEEIIYTCPMLLKGFCGFMADYTRQLFIENLKQYFKNK